jgi:asparagine synthase (glutamine-hydrolysing)
MLEGVDRLVDLTGTRTTALTGATAGDVADAVRAGDAARLAATDGQFAAIGREGRTVRLARTIGIPLRYFVAKM